MVNQKLNNAAMILLIGVLAATILIYGKPFFVPFTIAGLLSMLLLPVTKWLQSKGLGKVISILSAILILIGSIAVITFLIGWQIKDLSENASALEQQVVEKLKRLQQFIADKTGIAEAQQQKLIDSQQSQTGGSFRKGIGGILAGIGGLLTDTVVVFVYIFLFIYFRHKVKEFIIRIVPSNQKSNARRTIAQVQQVSQKYLTGLALMIVCLWIMYGIGFSIVGVKHAFFFAILCGLLEIVPFVGNLTGTLITVLMSLAQGGDANLIVGIIVTYAVIQFLQTYLLEPLVVGAGVNINPLFTIIGLVAGELMWGVPGMILAIPILAISRIVCDHVEALQPYAYLIGTEKETSGQEKLKRLALRVKKAFGGKK
jgi:predicted PurR-regulated permease PerM